MADYIFAVTSAERNFTVKDGKEFMAVFQALGFEESYTDKKNSVYIGGYERPIDDTDMVVLDKTGKAVAVQPFQDEYLDLDGNNVDEELAKKFDNEDGYTKLFWKQYIQNQLADDKQIAILEESGHEKLRYAVGYVAIISKYDIKEMSTGSFIYKTLKEMGVYNE